MKCHAGFSIQRWLTVKNLPQCGWASQPASSLPARVTFANPKSNRNSSCIENSLDFHCYLSLLVYSRYSIVFSSKFDKPWRKSLLPIGATLDMKKIIKTEFLRLDKSKANKSNNNKENKQQLVYYPSILVPWEQYKLKAVSSTWNKSFPVKSQVYGGRRRIAWRTTCLLILLGKEAVQPPAFCSRVRYLYVT